jgi:putative intracellular protease/amidase
MTDNVHVAVFDTLADWEIGHTTAHIRRPSWQRRPGRYRIVTVGPTREAVTTMGGLHVVPDLAVDELRPEDSAMLILAGGDTWTDAASTDDATTDDAMAGFRTAARRFLDAGVPVAAACGATFGLAVEGLLDERRHTSNAREFLQLSGYRGAHLYVDEPAVQDAGLITASGVAPVHFSRAIFAALDLYEPAVLASWFKLYGDRDPAGYVELMAG